MKAYGGLTLVYVAHCLNIIFLKRLSTLEIYFYRRIFSESVDRDCSVDMATDYGLNVPGIESL